MNLLAHLHLSGDSESLMIGNFIADFIKGNRFQHYQDDIIEGIFLHRQIDSYTDQHPLVKQSARRLRPDFGHYAGVIVDIFYDHFLARHFQKYSEHSLAEYAQRSYQVLQKHQAILPTRVQEFLPLMIQHNWLMRYAEFEGIEKALSGISRRTKYAVHLEKSVYNLEQDYAAFEKDFFRFFPQLEQHVATLISE